MLVYSVSESSQVREYHLLACRTHIMKWAFELQLRLIFTAKRRVSANAEARFITRAPGAFDKSPCS